VPWAIAFEARWWCAVASAGARVVGGTGEGAPAPPRTPKRQSSSSASSPAYSVTCVRVALAAAPDGLPRALHYSILLYSTIFRMRVRAA
jgi:hypothetical protein